MAKDSYSRGLAGHFVALFFLTMSSIAMKEMRLGVAQEAVFPHMEKIVTASTFANGTPLRTEYSGNMYLDTALQYLVAAFLPGVAGWDKSFQIQQIYFLVSFFPVIAIWSVEAGRRRNVMAWTSFTSVWGILYQTVGGGIVIPLYYLALLWESRSASYWEPSSRTVPTSYAKMLLPGLLAGYLIPTIGMYWPYNDLNFTQGIVGLWQFAPLLVNMLLFNPSVFERKPITPSTPLTDDVKYLNIVYITTFLVAALTHSGTIALTLTSNIPGVDIVRSLFRVPPSATMGFSEAIHYIFQVDFHTIFAAALVAAFVQFWDLKRAGKTDVSLWEVGAAMVIGTVLVGPGATLAGAWYVREGIMAEKEKEKK